MHYIDLNEDRGLTRGGRISALPASSRIRRIQRMALVLVVLANSDPPAPDNTARFIDDRPAGEGDRLEPSSPHWTPWNGLDLGRWPTRLSRKLAL